ncbi:Ate1p [Saccharomyces cerevisiae x Saccharomyces kudriavzevii VIN7]|uniref:arginyltransferase n=1 Tax=Saccharomyces cerevisiae x Saccharomyces kudriavzevii (strain VIN7) TaxID=1095631 RepID=H0GUW7_SACCK|nr:Ate1p [Saccharomyces cerevisiae x Saccharomyces kudriavzevii VIN7]CAI5271289.1 AIS_HP2_G0018850.mRNA.1.CDS.1 [Saccharomyces cerevisiae]CAI6512879.1 AIS_HP2_G0018850.mRNA.1.CDS.1 [Saccharomyces cerevisiae]
MSDRFVIWAPSMHSEPAAKCGYCHGSKGENRDQLFALDSWAQRYMGKLDAIEIDNCTIGSFVEHMDVATYDRLCNMGFRRSGKFLYKVDPLRNCCRLYTIRTVPQELNMTKELRKCVSRFVTRIVNDNSCTSPLPSRDFVGKIVDAELNSKTFHTRFEPAIYSDEKYQLFVKYQENVHQDYKNSPKSFKRFLCDTPFGLEAVLGTQESWDQLNNWQRMEPGEKLKHVGPVHECYYYEDKLIAITVSDILPSGISSVYFIWDPDYSKWSLGKLSALRDLAIIQKTNLQYYYLGYYIQDCPKMNYKASYGAEVLDVCHCKYIPLKIIKNMISRGRLFVLGEEETNVSRELQIIDSAAGKGARFFIDNSTKYKNIAEEIYGVKGSAFESANGSALQLKELYGIPYEEEDLDTIYHLKEQNDSSPGGIPNVVPGLLPLWELLHIMESGKITDLEGRLFLFEIETDGIRPLMNFYNEPPHVKKCICDLIRLFGFETCMKAVILYSEQM